MAPSRNDNKSTTASNPCVAEFTIEPFDEGNPGRHVTEAISAVEETGLSVNMGPFGTSVEGTAKEVSHAIEAALMASLAEGATRVTVTVDPTGHECRVHC